jgi:hypothetical protein
MLLLGLRTVWTGENFFSDAPRECIRIWGGFQPYYDPNDSAFPDFHMDVEGLTRTPVKCPYNTALNRVQGHIRNTGSPMKFFGYDYECCYLPEAEKGYVRPLKLDNCPLFSHFHSFPSLRRPTWASASGTTPHTSGLCPTTTRATWTS